MIVNINSGLGNQMFQYAFGRSLSITKKDDLYLDISGYKKEKKRKFSLDVFRINYKTATDDKINKERYPLGIISKIYFYISYKILLRIQSTRFIDSFMNNPKKSYFIGFWQSEKYFKNTDDVIRKEFALKNPLTEYTQVVFDKIKNVPISVSLHIRRGDYILEPHTNAYHGVCSLDYYQKAYEELTKRINSPFEIFVFSDDIEWVKQNLKLPVKMHFVSNPKIPDYEEMFLMSCCTHNIIANSSFSWWGAWLNPNKEKIVIAPEKWFANKKEDSREIVPESWIKI